MWRCRDGIYEAEEGNVSNKGGEGYHHKLSSMAYPGKQSVVIYRQEDTNIMTNHTIFIRYFDTIIS